MKNVMLDYLNKYPPEGFKSVYKLYDFTELPSGDCSGLINGIPISGGGGIYHHWISVNGDDLYKFIYETRKSISEYVQHININNRFIYVRDHVDPPPLGLTPKSIYLKNSRNERFNEVCGAIKRYWDADKEIPIEWILEYNTLLQIINRDKEDANKR